MWPGARPAVGLVCVFVRQRRRMVWAGLAMVVRPVVGMSWVGFVCVAVARGWPCGWDVSWLHCIG